MIDDDLPYWVAFSHVKGLGAVRFRMLLTAFPSLQEAWEATPTRLVSAGIPSRLVSVIQQARKKIEPIKITQEIYDKGIEVIRWDDDEYPSLLKTIATPPPILYIRGHLPLEMEKSVAIVGTRRMTSYGSSTAADLAEYLADNGVVTVSGMARGIDTVIHHSTVRHNGKTVAVLGSGVDIIYPAENRILAERIMHDGALVSDYPPGTPPDRTNFPPRNRIISGMAAATIVIEAGEKSGALITAKFAAEQGREVFVIPGNVNTPQSIGTNRLIRDGAIPLLQKEDLLDFMKRTDISKPKTISKPLQMSFEDPLEQRIIELISDEAVHIDEISRVLHLPAGKIGAILTMLEIKGFVTETNPNTYRKNQSLF